MRPGLPLRRRIASKWSKAKARGDEVQNTGNAATRVPEDRATAGVKDI